MVSKYVLLFLALPCLLAEEEKSIGEPWPMPVEYIKKEERVLIDADIFTFQIQEYDCGIVQSAFQRYYNYIFKYKNTNLLFKNKATESKELSTLQVVLMNPCSNYPKLKSDESYELKIDNNGAKLKAKEVWGVLRGLETFSQLVFKEKGKFQVRHTKIKDHPRFPWRGLLVDTARHFLPVPTLLSIIEGMSFNKLNVLHWHITDDQSFPFQSQTFPQLSKKGAYRPYTHEYTSSDVQEVIQYASLRGIRVVPEFDTPGHVRSWGKAISGLLTQCYDKAGKPVKGSYGPIDPTIPSNYLFLKKFFAEVRNVFVDSFLHLGGDEVSFACWATNPHILAFMKNMSFGTNFKKLESYYVQRLLNIVTSLKKQYLVWQEVFDNEVKLNKETVVHVWRGGWEKELKKITKSGHRAILSSPWYLDIIRYGASWRSYYKAQPDKFNGTSAEKALVMGGEASLWGEYVDATNVHSRLWPSASAVAERLWSRSDVADVKKAAMRIEEHRCRMLQRGILASPPSGPGFCDHEVAL